MQHESTTPHQHSFFDIVRRLRLLSDEAAEQLEAETAARRASPAEVALQTGVLSAVQIDIIETLRRPLEIVPGYEIMELIGRGGMGVVYRARQLNLDRVVALKTILVSQMEDESVAARFEREARVVAKLRHPNIVAAYDFGQHAGRLYFAMEFVEGEDVASLIDRSGPLSEAMAWGLARQAAAGLSHAAAQAIVHRDIKPANLLLVSPPEGYDLPTGMKMVKIADFGLAYLKSDLEQQVRLTSANNMVGSPYFMAPEQFSDGDVDVRGDVYSLGAVVYNMLSGKAPFVGQSLTQIATEKVVGTFPAMSATAGFSSASAELIGAMTHRDPEQRLVDYAELLSRIDLLAFSDETQTLPRPGVRPTATIDETERFDAPTVITERTTARPAAAKLVALAFAVVLVAASAALLMRPDKVDPGARELIGSGWSEYLFNGQDLQVWTQNSSGAWTVDQNEEGGVVLAGVDGRVRRSLYRRDGDERVPIEYYRLTIVVALHQAAAAEVRFGTAADSDPDVSSLAVRVTSSTVVFGRREGSSFQPLSSPRRLDSNTARVEIAIERQRQGWWTFVDGEGVAAFGFRDVPHRSEFQLAAEGGPAWFSDVIVDELVVE